MLAERLAVVAYDHDDGVLQQPQLDQVGQDAAHEVVLAADGVEPAVARCVIRVVRLGAVALHLPVVVVRGPRQEREDERLAAVALRFQEGPRWRP